MFLVDNCMCNFCFFFVCVCHVCFVCFLCFYLMRINLFISLNDYFVVSGTSTVYRHCRPLVFQTDITADILAPNR